MMLALEVLLLALAALGHALICIGLYNRNNALGWPRLVADSVEKVIVVLAPAAPLAFLAWRSIAARPPAAGLLTRWGSGDWPWPLVGYFAFCWLMLAVTVLRGLALQATRRRPPPALLSRDCRRFDWSDEIGPAGYCGWQSRAYGAIPGNESLRLCVSEKVLRVGRWPRALDGLTIAHLSDLHFSGRIDRGYFDRVIDETLALQPDLIAVTGDIIDDPQYVDWIAPTLGRLAAPQGVYFVLGNHDWKYGRKTNVRAAMTRSGLRDLGGRAELLTIRGETVLLAGNELPWFRPAPDMHHFPALQDGPFRLLLAHTPDQIGWARRHCFDLMLAGHTHGGQIRLPFIGPLVSPSWYGVKYTGGLFDERPTLMHVSRGISGKHPIRLNCLPELTRLALHGGPPEGVLVSPLCG